MNKLHFLIIIICLLRSNNANDDESDHKRVLASWLNPGCDIDQCKQNDSDLSIVYVRSSKYKDDESKSGRDLHFILSTYNSSPAFFIVSTMSNLEMKINWNGLINKSSNSINFMAGDVEAYPNNTVGILISQMFMWLDTEDAEADYLPGKCEQQMISPSDLKWKNVTVLEQTSDHVHVEFELKDEILNGTVTLRLMIASSLQKYNEPPRLLFTGKSIHSRLTFEGFEAAFASNMTKRLGIQFTVVSQGVKKDAISIDTFDDEYSPGIFTTYKYPFGKNVADSSFLSFRPNAYTTHDRLISQTIDTKQSSLIEPKDKETVFKQNNAFYGFYSNSKVNAYQMYITFGSKGQEFYTKTNVTEFSFVIGLGDLPEPEKSFFIKMVIIIGSGLSLLVLLIFPITIYLMSKKMKQRRGSGLLPNQDSIY